MARLADLTDWCHLPWSARLLAGSGFAVAVVLTAMSLQALSDPRMIALGAMLLAGGAFNVELGRLAEGGPVQSNRLSKGLSAWPFAAALLLPLGAAGLIAGVLYAHCRFRGIQVPLWKWINSWAIVSLAGAATSLLLSYQGGTLAPGGSAGQLLLILVAAALFLGVEAALLLLVTWFNRREDLAYHMGLRRLDFYFTEYAEIGRAHV